MVALVDSRSIHNFIDSRMVQHLNLLQKCVGKLEAVVAGSDKLVSLGKCSLVVSFQLQRISFVIDFSFILPLDGYNVLKARRPSGRD